MSRSPVTASAGVIEASVTNDFGYNLRSEVTTAAMGTNLYGYVYDPIGNRLSATNNAGVTTYTANNLNQYTEIDPYPADPGYDPDGNMTTNGLWVYTWDGENRLIAASSNGTAVATYAYDYMGRRIHKATATTTNTFVYDGWAMIRERRATGAGTATNSFVYGLDLSQTFQGAGTIGGLIFANLGGTTAWYGYDANGNVTDLVSTNGTSLAHYEYDPFGNTTVATGSLAASNPYRFSTKYTDDETGLLYYGLRYDSTQLGRWLSRDPTEEEAGWNLQAFVINAPLLLYDSLGMVYEPKGVKIGPALSVGAVIPFGFLAPGALEAWYWYWSNQARFKMAVLDRYSGEKVADIDEWVQSPEEIVKSVRSVDAACECISYLDINCHYSWLKDWKDTERKDLSFANPFEALADSLPTEKLCDGASVKFDFCYSFEIFMRQFYGPRHPGSILDIRRRGIRIRTTRGENWSSPLGGASPFNPFDSEGPGNKGYNIEW